MNIINTFKKEFIRSIFRLFSAIYSKFCNYKIFEDFIEQKSAELMKKNGWADTVILSEVIVVNWLDYYALNREKIGSKLKILTHNLENESKIFARYFCERNFNLFPLKIHQNIHKFNVKNLYTDMEIIEQQKFDLNKENVWPEIVNYYSHGLWYIEEKIKKYIEGKDFIDGGAYTGDSALIFTKYNPSKIFCFEPNTCNYNSLKNVIKENNYEDRIYPIKSGIGERNSFVKFYGEQDSCSSINLNNSQIYEKVQIISIDEFVNKNRINIGLIKLDIEGMEFEAIKGALNTIKKQKPVLLISIYHTPEDFFEIKPLLEQQNINYTFIIRSTSPYSLNTECMLIGYPKGLD